MAARARASYYDRSMPPLLRLSACELFSRAFALLDDLDCWRSAAVPQLLSRLLSLHPPAFADTVIARIAFSPPPVQEKEEEDERKDGERKYDGAGVVLAALQPSATQVAVDGAVGPWVSCAEDIASSGGGGGLEGRAGDASKGGTWQQVLSSIMARAMPALARGCLRGSERWYNRMDPAEGVNADGSSRYPSTAGRSACKPMSLMVMAVEQTTADCVLAARLVQNNISHDLWRIEKERLATWTNGSASAASFQDAERTLEELSAVIWNLGSLRQAIIARLRGKTAERTGSVIDEQDPTPEPPNSLERLAAAEATVATDGATISPMLSVVEELQSHVLRILEAEASAPLPECQHQSFARNSTLLMCPHIGRRPGSLLEQVQDGEVEEEGIGNGSGSRKYYCVTCDEVIKPFLVSPYECWTSWVPEGGHDDSWGEISVDLCQRLGVQIFVEQSGSGQVRGRMAFAAARVTVLPVFLFT